MTTRIGYLTALTNGSGHAMLRPPRRLFASVPGVELNFMDALTQMPEANAADDHTPAVHAGAEPPGRTRSGGSWPGPHLARDRDAAQTEPVVGEGNSWPSPARSAESARDESANPAGALSPRPDPALRASAQPPSAQPGRAGAVASEQGTSGDCSARSLRPSGSRPGAPAGMATGAAMYLDGAYQHPRAADPAVVPPAAGGDSVPRPAPEAQPVRTTRGQAAAGTRAAIPYASPRAAMASAAIPDRPAEPSPPTAAVPADASVPSTVPVAPQMPARLLNPGPPDQVLPPARHHMPLQPQRSARANAGPAPAQPVSPMLSIGTIEVTVLAPPPDPPAASTSHGRPRQPPQRLSRGLGPRFGQGQT